MDVQWFPYESTQKLIQVIEAEWKHEDSGNSLLRTQDSNQYVDYDDVIIGKYGTQEILDKIKGCAESGGKLYVMGHGFGAKEGRPEPGNEFIAIWDPDNDGVLRTSYAELGNVILEAIDHKTPLTIYLYMCWGGGEDKRFGPRLRKCLNERGHIYVKVYGSAYELNAASMNVHGGGGMGMSVSDEDAFEECLSHS
jgi:hypothetical protein